MLSKAARLIFLISLLATTGSPAQQNIPDQDSEIIIISSGNNLLRWHAYAERTYFIQYSDPNFPLGKWYWVPMIERANDIEISHEVGATSGKAFFRLKYTDLPLPSGETVDTADFDDDGISNINEVKPPPPLLASDATDPLDPDTGHDGLLDGWEKANGLDANDPGTENPDNGANGDLDFDGLSNIREQAVGGNPKNSDTDQDGATDAEEAASGHDLASNQSHPPIWIRTQRRAFHGLPYIQSTMDWNLAGTVHHDGSPTFSAPSTCATFLAADCPFPAQPLVPGYSPYNGYAVGLVESAGWRPHPGYDTSLTQTRFWRKTLPAPTAALKTKLLKVTRRVVHGPNYSELVFPPVTEIIEVVIPAGTSTSEPFDALPNFTETLVGEEAESVRIDLIPLEITAAFGAGPDEHPPGREVLEPYLESIKIAKLGNVWAVKGKDDYGNERIWGVEIVTNQDKLNEALSKAGQYVIFDGHSNYGLGPDFPTIDDDGGTIIKTTIDDYTNFGVGYTNYPTSHIQLGDLEVNANQIPTAPTNYKPDPIDELRFPNIDGVEEDEPFPFQGEGLNAWHYRDEGVNEEKMLMINAPDSDLPTNLRYKTFFYNACFSGLDYIENFDHGDFVYTTQTCFVSKATKVFVQGVVEGKTTKQIIPLLNSPGVGSDDVADVNIYDFEPF